VKDNHLPSWAFWVVCVVRPCIDSERGWMPYQIENLNKSLPSSVALQYSFHKYASHIFGFDAMQPSNSTLEFFEVFRMICHRNSIHARNIAS